MHVYVMARTYIHYNNYIITLQIGLEVFDVINNHQCLD